MKPPRGALSVFLLLIAGRLAAMAALPLADTTEARYGEMARKMLETGNWVTPLHDYGVPFWGKPPLWSWMSAGSMGVFGVNEFAARLPGFLLSVLTVWLVAHLARSRGGARAGWAPALILAGSLGFFACAGTVMTDAALAFCVTLILVAFWRARHRGPKIWSWVFFIGCGLGLLAKGPVALILAGLPVFFWTLIRGSWRGLWRDLPWLRGSVLTALIAAPWYALAEARTPGFLNYFLLGEHFGRFFDKGWTGDRYGFAHAVPHGIVWLFAIAAFLPWTFFLPKLRKVWRDADGWTLFLALWAVSGLVLFTLSANIIWPYVLPALPALALMLAEGARRGAVKPPLVPLAALAGAVGLLAPVLMIVIPHKIDVSHRAAARAWSTQDPEGAGHLVFWPYPAPQFSAAFYTGGRAWTAKTADDLKPLLSNHRRDYVAARAGDMHRLPRNIKQAFEETARVKTARGETILLREKAVR